MDILLCELHADVKNMEIHREFNQIMSGKNKKNLLVTFLNIDRSVDIAHYAFESGMCFLKIQMEGSMSQNFDLGPSFYFIKYRILCITNVQQI